MSTFKELLNPFTVQTPEGMTAEDTVNLFIDILGDYPKILHEGHLFLHGPRGSGKSMIFRYLMPDCQKIKYQSSFKELPFFSFLVSVKRTFLNRTELRRLDEKHASVLINEHFMTVYITELVLESLKELKICEKDSLKNYMKDVFFANLERCGCNKPSIDKLLNEESDCFDSMINFCKSLRAEVSNYIKSLSFPPKDVVPYSGPLCNYIDFLFPLLCGLKKLPFFPNKPIYLLVDDADFLSATQTQILNTWVSSRTSSDVSIKISTQLRYKTWRTVAEQLIETPHDYSEVNIATTYTASTSKSKYKEQVKAIIEKRLDKKVGIKVQAEVFFPPETEQEGKIKKIYQEHIEKWETEGRGHNPNDDAYRYARPDYIKSLGGTRKGTYNYSYSGFDEHLVHISSGIIRNFLTAAAEMFDEMKATKPDDEARFIPPNVQSNIVRKKANEFIFDEFEKIKHDELVNIYPTDNIDKLYLLIQSMGGIFREILVSDRSERRVFSVAISGILRDKSVIDVLKLGTEFGYFHKSSIGNKTGTGRTPLYILNRVLAPHFNLDPTGFAGYLFVTEDHLKLALNNPAKFIEERLKYNDKNESKQAELF
jgi:hypothetical protein